MSATSSERINRAIDLYGEFVDIESYSDQTYSEYGDLISQTTSDYVSIPAIYNTYGKSAPFETEGVFLEGDVSFFFKGNQSGIEESNTIIRENGERWKISKVTKHSLKGTPMVIEAKASNE